ncbi:MAG: hypothetical protein K6T26_07410, partial [Alicyclobacillus sp.]|nr:hypothetical protein [Alicyclobacillus sp.]
MISTRTKLGLSLTVVAAVLGFMMSLQYKQQLAVHLAGGAPLARDADTQKMATQLQALKQENAQQLKELQDINTQLAAFERQSAGSGTLRQLQQRLQDERILAGVTAVQGPGISVTLM